MTAYRIKVGVLGSRKVLKGMYVPEEVSLKSKANQLAN